MSKLLDIFLGSPTHVEFRQSQFQELCIEDPERAFWIADAAEQGEDGSTHAGHLADWREWTPAWVETYVEGLERQFVASNPELAGFTTEAFEVLQELLLEQIGEEIDELEAWHEANGSLHEGLSSQVPTPDKGFAEFGCDVAEHFYRELKIGDRGTFYEPDSEENLDCYVFDVTDEERQGLGIRWQKAYLFIDSAPQTPLVTAQSFAVSEEDPDN